MEASKSLQTSSSSCYAFKSDRILAFNNQTEPHVPHYPFRDLLRNGRNHRIVWFIDDSYCFVAEGAPQSHARAIESEVPVR